MKASDYDRKYRQLYTCANPNCTRGEGGKPAKCYSYKHRVIPPSCCFACAEAVSRRFWEKYRKDAKK